MSNRSFNITKLIEYLHTIPRVASELAGKMYYWSSFKLDWWIILKFSIISQTLDFDETKTARIELTFIWTNENIDKQELIQLQEIVIEELCYMQCLWVKNLAWFHFNFITEGQKFRETTGSKNRNNLTKDILIYFNR